MDSLTCSKCEAELASQWIVCPLCAYPTPKAASSRFLLVCTECNKAISSEDQTCPHCHVPIVRRYCSGCSRLVPDQALFCPHCDTPATAQPGIFKRYRVAALMVVLAVVGGYYVAPPAEQWFQAWQQNRLLAYAKPIPKIAEEPKVEPLPVEQPKPPIPAQVTTPEPASEITSDVPETQSDLLPPSDGSLEAEEVQSTPLDLTTEGSRMKEGRRLAEVGQKLMDQHRYAEAVTVLTTAVETFPPSSDDLTYGDALYRLGSALRLSGHPDQAVPVLQKAMRFPMIRSRVSREVAVAQKQLR